MSNKQGDAYVTELYDGDVDSRDESGDNGGYKDGSEYEEE